MYTEEFFLSSSNAIVRSFFKYGYVHVCLPETGQSAFGVTEVQGAGTSGYTLVFL